MLFPVSTKGCIMKNVSYKFHHQKLGDLAIQISSGENISKTSNIIPKVFIVKHKQSDTITFLCALYELYSGNNDTMTDIIGEYLVTSHDNKTVEQISKEISEKYTTHVNKKSAKQNAPISAGDGIDIRIVKKTSPNDPLYTANIIVKKHSGELSAHIDEQKTEEKYQKQGLMSLAIGTYLPRYCESNNIANITLETGEIGGVDKNTLKKIYESLGFEKGKGDLLVKSVNMENIDDYNM